MTKVFRVLVLSAFLAAGLVRLGADAPTPAVTLESTYTFTAQEDPGLDWSSLQSADLALSGRWGQALALQGRVHAGFDNTALTADGLIQQLALTWDVTPWSIVTFGKQRLKWGTARVFSAIDGLEPTYDPARPNAVLDGVTGVKAEVLPTEWLSVAALALPTPRLADTMAAGRADVLWDDADLSAGAIRSVTGGENIVTVFGDAARFFDRFGVYGEAQAKLRPGRDTQVRATGGLQVDVPVWLHGTLTILTEYHYNDAGTEAGGGVGTSGNHYGALSAWGLPVTERWTLGGTVLTAFDSGFFLARAGTTYNVDQNLSVSADYTRFDTLRSGTPSELDRISIRNQITVAVTGTF